jgi:opine dehydrogenase
MNTPVVDRRVAVIGAGAGGLAVAAFAGLSGWQVNIHDVRESALSPIRDAGGIRVSGAMYGFVRVDRITTHAREVIRGANLIVAVVPGPDQAAAVRALAPHINEEQILLLHPGCTGGALEARAILRSRGKANVTVAESDSFLFGCSIPVPGQSEIIAIKKRFAIATMPASRTSEALATIKRLFPQAVAAPTVLHTSLANMNAVLHVPTMLANAGRIEEPESNFAFYGQGIGPSVARLIEAYDNERLEVCSALGISTRSLTEWIFDAYGVRENGLLETIQRLDREVYRNSQAPSHLRHRYLTEDAPCGTVPTAALGSQLGLEMGVHWSCVRIASLLCAEDYGQTGRTLDRIGLAGLNPEEIRALVT